MELSDLLRRLAETLERLQIPYLVTGSLATVAYGEPRFTNDIDVVVDLRPEQVDAFCAAFPDPDFYCPQDMVRQSVQQRFPFNILHPESGLKIDVIMATDSEFDRNGAWVGPFVFLVVLGSQPGSPRRKMRSSKNCSTIKRAAWRNTLAILWGC